MKKSTSVLSVHMLKMAVFNIIVHRRINLPTAIGIEISTACNRRCVYCPQSVEPQKQNMIDPKIWNIFLDRIKELRWKGATAITKYNEPSLHPDSVKFVGQLRELGCRPLIFSNGDRPNVIREWCEAGAFRVRVTEHPPYRDEWWEKLRPVMLDYPDILRVERLKWVHNQAGKVEGEKIDHCFSAHGISCNINGTVSMCCVDYNSKYLVGDITKQSFEEIWNSKAHKTIRNKVIRGIPATPLCENCLT